MAEETSTGGATDGSICPWCSATYIGAAESCPSCGATLVGDAALDPSLPGLTAIDAAAIVRAKQPVAKPRNRLLSWISGEFPEDGGPPGDAAALAPPAGEVRREILRLELEAEVANLRAEADALMAEAQAEGRVHPAPQAPDPVETDPVADADSAPEADLVLDAEDLVPDADAPAPDDVEARTPPA